VPVRLYLTDQADEWQRFVTRLPEHLRDVHFLPGMMAPYEACGMGQGMLLVDESPNGFLIQPLLRNTNGEIRHPFNFGGPIATPDHNQPTPELRGPVFCTLNPFLAEEQRKLVNGADHTKDVVWVDLTGSIKLRQTTRHCVQKAEHAGATFEAVEPKGYVQMAQFHGMYIATMQRNNAKPHWLFPLQWYISFLHNLQHHATLFLAYIEGRVLAGCILLHGFRTCYYHFAASTGEDPNINHFMVAKAIEWAQVNGHKRFHLGGGVAPDDGLFRFKAGFSTLRAPVYQYQWGGPWQNAQSALR
jgi:hypothetical protein